MASIRLRFDIAPVAKQRARCNTFNNRFYTPKETRTFESLMKMMGKAMYKGTPMEGPLSLRVWFFIEKKKSVRLKFPHKRPDLDNYVKAVKDAMNGVLWWDDAQVVDLEAKKRYGVPAIVVEVDVVSTPVFDTVRSVE